MYCTFPRDFFTTKHSEPHFKCLSILPLKLLGVNRCVFFAMVIVVVPQEVPKPLTWSIFWGVFFNKCQVRLPGTQMALVLIGKGLVLGGWPSKIEIIWVPGIVNLPVLGVFVSLSDQPAHSGEMCMWAICRGDQIPFLWKKIQMSSDQNPKLIAESADIPSYMKY